MALRAKVALSGFDIFNAIVKKSGSEIDATDAAQILSVITEETGVSASKVIITPYSV